MKITFKNMATVKRIAEACNKPLADKQKKLDKIAALADEIDQLDKSMDLMQQAIAPITGGKKVEDILVRVTSNGVSKWIPNPEKWKWNETEKVWEEIEDAAPAGESAEEAASRELMEETGIQIAPSHMQQFRTFSKPGRDPRGWTVSTAFIQFVDPEKVKAKAGDDAKEAAWFDVIIGRESTGPDIYRVRLVHGDDKAYAIFRMLPEGGAIDAPRLEILESGGLAFDHGDIAAYTAAWLMRR
jgi:hypothetical protein